MEAATELVAAARHALEAQMPEPDRPPSPPRPTLRSALGTPELRAALITRMGEVRRQLTGLGRASDPHDTLYAEAVLSLLQELIEPDGHVPPSPPAERR
jgi:hypothetical protein